MSGRNIFLNPTTCRLTTRRYFDVVQPTRRYFDVVKPTRHYFDVVEPTRLYFNVVELQFVVFK